MDILAKEQSDLLKLLESDSDNEISFSSLTPEQQEDFRFLARLKYITVFDSEPYDYDYENDALVYIPVRWCISPEGRQYLANEHLSLQHEEYYHQEVEHLQSLARHAQADADSAKHEAQIAKILTVISVLIALASLILDFFKQ